MAEHDHGSRLLRSNHESRNPPGRPVGTTVDCFNAAVFKGQLELTCLHLIARVMALWQDTAWY